MPGASDQSNIIRLYEELGVRPADGLERLTERYRQRLRELHPDSRVDSDEGQAVDEQAGGDGLGWLTRSYREASAFARLHGRLPGADAGIDASPAAPRESAPRDSGSASAMPGRARGRKGTRRGRRGGVPLHSGWRWLIATTTIIAAVLFAVPELLEPPDVTPFSRDLGAPVPAVHPVHVPAPDDNARAVSREPDVHARQASAPALIRVGSSMDDVLTIQGAPTLQEDDVWQYGPSFVRFQNGRVRDWHSSPLQPLRVATPR
jgi:hypothetical protein